MALKKYIVATAEGAAHFAAELGAEVEYDLEPDVERALIAAGWVNDPDAKAEEPGNKATQAASATTTGPKEGGTS